jgi:hypothetical protein
MPQHASAWQQLWPSGEAAKAAELDISRAAASTIFLVIQSSLKCIWAMAHQRGGGVSGGLFHSAIDASGGSGWAESGVKTPPSVAGAGGGAAHCELHETAQSWCLDMSGQCGIGQAGTAAEAAPVAQETCALAPPRRSADTNRMTAQIARRRVSIRMYSGGARPGSQRAVRGRLVMQIERLTMSFGSPMSRPRPDGGFRRGRASPRKWGRDNACSVNRDPRCRRGRRLSSRRLDLAPRPPFLAQHARSATGVRHVGLRDSLCSGARQRERGRDDQLVHLLPFQMWSEIDRALSGAKLDAEPCSAGANTSSESFG